MTSDAYNFPYAWRWTQPTHNVFPPEVMAQIKPLDQSIEPVGAAQLWQIAFTFDLVHTTSADVSVEAGKNWLRALPVAQSDRVIVR